MRLFLLLLAVCAAGPLRAQSLTGTTSLVLAPTAVLLPDAHVSAGAGYVSARYSHYQNGAAAFVPYYVSIGYLPFLELSFRFSLLLAGEQALGDRMVSVRVGVLREGRLRPAVAVGAHDLLAAYSRVNTYFNALYAVASKHAVVPVLGTVGLHAGVGTDVMEAQGHEFVGPFGGVSVRPVDFAEVLVDYDGRTLNTGLRLSAFDALFATVALRNGSAFVGGVSARIGL